MLTCRWTCCCSVVEQPVLTARSFAFSDGFNSIPLPFECSITPRSKKHALVVEREFQEAREKLQIYTAATRLS